MKTCAQCQSSFEVTEGDRQFYDRISPVFGGQTYPIPEPTLCPQCRMRRRMVWRSELHLFKHKSDFSGKMMLSSFPPEAPYRVISSEEFWSDDWDPLATGRDFDFSRPFFDQFAELVKDTPLISLTVINNQNSEYVNNAGWNKDCYLVAGANRNESCYYGNFINHSKNIVDSSFVRNSEFCYECIDCTDSYNLKYSANCTNCSDSFFLFNCKNSRHCFGSVNLVNREYVFMNEQLSKEDYFEKLNTLDLDQRSRVLEAKTYFKEHRLKYPHKYMIGEMNEGVSGNVVYHSRNAFDCYDASDLEDCRYCAWFHTGKNCMDIYSWGYPNTEECYECLEVGDNSRRVFFSVTTQNSDELFYTLNCMQSNYLFGCVSLKRSKYCILNKQYSKAEYETLIPKIITHMQETGEWGEFFPMWVSPLAYNQTIAIDYFPLKKDEVLALRAKWNEGAPITSPALTVEISDSIHEVENSICDQILTCAECRRPYKIIPQEFQFYKTQTIPVPDRCFQCRHQSRLKARNPRRLWDRNCAKCSAEIQTSYAPYRPELVYCEACYLEEVY